MTPDDQQILSQLQKISQDLDQIKTSISKRNTAAESVLNGFLSSLGNIIGTTLFILVLIYLVSKLNINFNQLVAKYLEQTMSQVNWSKIIPTPKLQIDPSVLLKAQ